MDIVDPQSNSSWAVYSLSKVYHSISVFHTNHQFIKLMYHYSSLSTSEEISAANNAPFFSTEKDWYLSYFSMKTYVVGTNYNHLAEALLCTHHYVFKEK